MATVNYPTLVTTKYVVPGSYFSQLIQPSAGVAPDTRLPCYVGAGSRFGVARNQTIRRAFVYDETLSFGPNAPFVAALAHSPAANDKTLARMVKDGTNEEVKFTQWDFVNIDTLSTTVGPFTGVTISPEVYDPAATYKVSYQSLNRAVVDTFPVADIREFISVGDSPDATTYTEFENFFADYSVTSGVLGDELGLKAADANQNKTRSVSAVTKVGGGSGTITNATSAYTHNYNRYYTVECLASPAPGGSPGSFTASFKWSAQPVSAGNDTLPAVPIHTTVAWPSFAVTEPVSHSVEVELELGVKVTINFDLATNFSAGDKFTFNAYGPARIEIDPRLANINQYTEAGAITKTAGAGYATMAYATTTSLPASLTQNSKYRVQCTAATDNSVPATVTLDDGGGNGVVLTAKVGGTAGNAITVALVDPGVANAPLTVSVVGNAVVVNLATNNAAALISTYTQIAAAITAATSAPITAVTTGVGGTVAVAAPATNLATGANGTFTAVLAWAEYGERVGISGISGTLTYVQNTPVAQTLALNNGVVLAVGFSAGPLAIGDTFEFEVKAPREYYKAKDNRIVTITTDSAATGTVGMTYVTNTIEGHYGSVTASDNEYIPTATGWQHGVFTLPGNLLLAARNLHAGPTPPTGGNRHVATNKFTFSATLAGTIDWSLVSTKTETFTGSQVLTDVVGTVTGSSATPYLILANVPDSMVSVLVDSAPVSYSLLTDSQGANTQYVAFVTRPAADSTVQISYIYRGAEPAPGQIYYVSSKHVRPDTLFNTPILVTSLEEGRALLAPAEATNHLWIMNEIAMGDVGAPGMYVVQVKDSDGDGFLTNLDYKDAITASEAPRAVTDLVVLSHFASLSDQLASLDRMADPFKRRFRMGWFGAASGTSIGSENEPGSLIYLARRTLQVTGNNPAHGTRVLVRPTTATRDIRLDNGTVTTVTLDGSFVAGALAAMVAAFPDPADTLLRRNLPGFATVETDGDVESPTNLLLGASNIVFMTDRGAGVFRIEEDVTVDTFAPDYNLINNMVQKMYVNKNIRDQLDQKVVGLVVSSAEAGVTIIKGYLLQALTGLLGRGLIGRYQNADGSDRALDPSKDIEVYRDPTDPTLYHVLYCFFLRNTIKRVFGLYSVNTNDFGAGR